MNNISLNEATRRDFLVCLGIWLGLEAIAFGVLPSLGLGRSVQTLPWILTSAVLGLSGALLLAISARLVTRASQQRRQLFTYLLGQLGSWLGLAGMAFPLLAISTGLLSELLNKLTGS